MAAKKKSASKGKKKQWVTIVSPKVFGENPLGESLVYEPNDLLGRKITVNLMSIMRDMRKQHINIKFKIEAINNNRATTRTLSYSVVPASIKRLIRKGRDKIEESFVARTKDNINIMIKTTLVTRNNVPRSTSTSIRKHLKNVVARMAKDIPFEKIISDLISSRFQRTIKEKLSTIYPLRSCEVRKVEIMPPEAPYIREDLNLSKQLKVKKPSQSSHRPQSQSRTAPRSAPPQAARPTSSPEKTQAPAAVKPAAENKLSA